jgi:hypothetical protein
MVGTRFVPSHVDTPLVYSALLRSDRDSLRSLTRLGFAESALIVMPELRWFLTRHYGTIQQYFNFQRRPLDALGQTDTIYYLSETRCQIAIYGIAMRR